MKWVFHESQGSFHSDHMFLMVIYNASSRWQIYCLLDDALQRDFGYMNCWAQNILVQVCLAQPVCRHFIGIHGFMANLYVGIL